jgi:hypothetical protein
VCVCVLTRKLMKLPGILDLHLRGSFDDPATVVIVAFVICTCEESVENTTTTRHCFLFCV